MTRLVLGGVAAAILLLLPATAQGDSASRVRGAVVSKSAATHHVALHAQRTVMALRVPGSLTSIHVGQRVELRGSTLRSLGATSHVLARRVSVVAVRSAGSSSAEDEPEDDEVEITGTLTALSPVTVTSTSRTATCVAPAGVSLAGFAVGDLVEITCDLKAGVWVLRKLEHEDDDENEADEDHGANRGPGNTDDEHGGDHSGPGGGGDDGGHGGHSGPGGGGDD